MSTRRLRVMYIQMYIYLMTKRYSIAEARSNLPGIVDQAEAGMDIELTRRGKPVAVVVSLREYARLRGARPSFGQAYKQFLATHALSEVGLDQDFFADTRDITAGRDVAL